MMNPSQPSLWDNAPLENGYRHLAELRLPEAAANFREALVAGAADHAEIVACLAAAAYWQRMLEADPPLATADLLEDYSRFNFSGKMNAFRKAVLLSVIGLSRPHEGMDATLLPDALDLLLAVKAFPQAEELAARYISMYPGNHALLYVLGKAQWLNDNKVEAYRSYTGALLYCPEDRFVESIQPLNLKDLISRHGPYMAPAYGWIGDLLPFVDLKEVPEPAGPAHKHALGCYLLLQKAQKSFGKPRQSKDHIGYRKELQQQDSALFRAYLNRLNMGEHKTL